MQAYIWKDAEPHLDDKFREIYLGAKTPGGEFVDRCKLSDSDIEDLFDHQTMHFIKELPPGRSVPVKLTLDLR